MKRSVIFLTDAEKAPAGEWIDALTSAGVCVVVTDPRVETRPETTGQSQVVLCQIDKAAQPEQLKSILEYAHRQWPDLPVIACRSLKMPAFPRKNDNEVQLKLLGFRTVADSPAQLPALLRQIEDGPTTGELQPLARLEEDQHFDNFSLPDTLRATHLRTAIALVAKLHFASDQKRAGQVALNGIMRLAPADNWSLFLAPQTGEADSALLELLVTKTAPSTLFASSHRSISRVATNQGETLVASEVARLAASRMESLVTIESGKRIAAVPLLAQERVLGVIQGVRTRRGFSEKEIALLVALATPIAAALANSVRIADAERLSMTDDLTKLNNARYLRHFLVNEIKRARRYGSNVAALFIDLDDFKQVNDLHGHLVGSHVLMELAGVILPSVRDTDCVIRYGGDEFVVILTESKLDKAVQVADRIRQKIEGHVFTGGRRLKISLTGSFGVAVFPQHALSPQQLITCADRAMYEAKAAGKNCVRVASSNQEEFSETFRNLNVAVEFQKFPDEKLVS